MRYLILVFILLPVIFQVSASQVLASHLLIAEASPQTPELNSAVVTTIKPIHALVGGVMGNTGTPALLIDGITSPHNYALKPSQRALLQRAEIVFMIDPYYESFLAKALQEFPDKMSVVQLSTLHGVTLLNNRQAGAWDRHQQKTTVSAAEDAAMHHHEREVRAYAGSSKDLHLWLDPRNAMAFTNVIAEQLGILYPQHREIYKQNARAQIARLEVLDAALAVQLAPVKETPFIVFHDAYQYLQHRYGLLAVGSVTIDPSQPVSAKRVQNIRQKLVDTGAVCVFREPQFNDKLVHTVIEGTTVKSGILDPIGTDIPAGSGLYEQVLRQMAAALVSCLQ